MDSSGEAHCACNRTARSLHNRREQQTLLGLGDFHHASAYPDDDLVCTLGKAFHQGGVPAPRAMRLKRNIEIWRAGLEDSREPSPQEAGEAFERIIKDT